mmetsp:Transcript_31557/g.66816  ORF Transcript_31557/g.66816 Transcript_31557/m.66816 type:complete len:169 (-) Transcript_31557:16-522(-)
MIVFHLWIGGDGKYDEAEDKGEDGLGEEGLRDQCDIFSHGDYRVRRGDDPPAKSADYATHHLKNHVRQHFLGVHFSAKGHRQRDGGIVMRSGDWAAGEDDGDEDTADGQWGEGGGGLAGDLDGEDQDGGADEFDDCFGRDHCGCYMLGSSFLLLCLCDEAFTTPTLTR